MTSLQMVWVKILHLYAVLCYLFTFLDHPHHCSRYQSMPLFVQGLVYSVSLHEFHCRAHPPPHLAPLKGQSSVCLVWSDDCSEWQPQEGEKTWTHVLAVGEADLTFSCAAFEHFPPAQALWVVDLQWWDCLWRLRLIVLTFSVVLMKLCLRLSFAEVNVF